MPRTEFDNMGFYQALDSERASRSLNWKEVSELSGVSASTLTRLAQGKRPDVDSLAGLVSWAGLSADDYLKAEGSVASASGSLTKITSYLRNDPNLNKNGRDAMINMVTAAYMGLKNSPGE
jgi:transcriptional regulator with XRE-family HTH domain